MWYDERRQGACALLLHVRAVVWHELRTRLAHRPCCGGSLETRRLENAARVLTGIYVVHEPSGVGNTNGILEENMKGRL